MSETFLTLRATTADGIKVRGWGRGEQRRRSETGFVCGAVWSSLGIQAALISSVRPAMVQRAVVVVVVIFSAYVVAQPGQTFQSTVFDIPAELPSEDYAVLSQLDDAPTQKVQDPLKPKKINKAALNLPQVQPTLPTVPQPPPVQPLQPPPQPATPAPFTLPTHPAFPTFTFPTHPPFTLPTHPTIAPFTLPGAPTPPPPPFVLPTHPTMAPFTFPTHPTFAPFTFPTHPTFAPYTAAPPPFGPQSSQEPLQPQTGQAPQPNQGFQQIGTQAQVPQTPTVQPQFSGLPQQPNQPQPPPQQQQLQLQQSIDARPQQFTKPVSTNQQQGVPQRRFEQTMHPPSPVDNHAVSSSLTYRPAKSLGQI
ncbi:hypothetical protein COOONC_15387 [Cooperia oncophora]